MQDATTPWRVIVLKMPEYFIKRWITYKRNGWTNVRKWEKLKDGRSKWLRVCQKKNNGFDCGVYTCMYAKYVSERKKIDYCPEFIPYFRKKMMYEIGTGPIGTGL